MAAGAQSYAAVLDSPVGRLGVRVADGRLCAVDFLQGDEPPSAPSDACSSEVAEQLRRYFLEPCTVISVPVVPSGTDFQRRVREALLQIPAGTTRRYGDLARDLGTSARAVGNACRANPLPIVVPCHRVVGATGLGGYAGATAGQALAAKTWLLRHEARCARA
jgi:methylated-DNA-[protein]-cysteine S-methyltransferase